MRILIVSDIHSNLEALDTVLLDAERYGALDAVWCLGDIVGYGPDPVACVDRLRGLQALAISGNHDAAAVGRESLDKFNYYAAEACRWTMTQLTPEAYDYLTALPTSEAQEPFVMVHGMPRDPLWGYLLSYGQAADAWYETGAKIVMIGHSHLPFACIEGTGLQRPGADGLRVEVGNLRLAINPGSVGQPRDGDPRAAYAIYDEESEAISLGRVWYDIAVTQRRMAEAGLPEPLIARLSAGR